MNLKASSIHANVRKSLHFRSDSDPASSLSPLANGLNVFDVPRFTQLDASIVAAGGPTDPGPICRALVVGSVWLGPCIACGVSPAEAIHKVSSKAANRSHEAVLRGVLVLRWVPPNDEPPHDGWSLPPRDIAGTMQRLSNRTALPV
jgi:hypothetical protein